MPKTEKPATKKSTSTESRGGAREGAGRPPGEKGGYLVCYAKFALFDEFMNQVDMRNQTMSALLREVVTDWLASSSEED